MQARQKQTVKVGGRGREAREIPSAHVWSEESQSGEKKKDPVYSGRFGIKSKVRLSAPISKATHICACLLAWSFAWGLFLEFIALENLQKTKKKSQSLISYNVHRVYPRNRSFIQLRKSSVYLKEVTVYIV